MALTLITQGAVSPTLPRFPPRLPNWKSERCRRDPVHRPPQLMTPFRRNRVPRTTLPTLAYSYVTALCFVLRHHSRSLVDIASSEGWLNLHTLPVGYRWRVNSTKHERHAVQSALRPDGRMDAFVFAVRAVAHIASDPPSAPRTTGGAVRRVDAADGASARQPSGHRAN